MMDSLNLSRKRGRDEDGDDVLGGVVMEGVPLEKRQRNAPANMAFFDFSREIRPTITRAQTLPFRVEHPHSPPPPLAAYESADADSPSSASPSAENSPASFVSLPVPADMPDIEMAMDEEISIVGSASPPSPYQQHTWLRPAKLNSPDQFSGGRIPTPIHSNFHLGAPPRTASHGAVQQASDDMILAPPRQRPHLMENNYRLPSPISEDTAQTPTDIPSSQLSRLSFAGDDGMDVDSIVPPSPLLPFSPTRTGRARSGAISAITGNGQEKKRFVVGYREDCEKCRARMPGHWAHFLPI